MEVQEGLIDDVVLTLYEGHYHLGVGALINSLSNALFSGRVIVGYKGDLPEWLKQLSVENGIYTVDSNISLQFVPVLTSYHYGYYKPMFIKQILTAYPAIKTIYYFDPDIVVNAPWTFFKEWVESGVALCLDESFEFVHENHPWRRNWLKLAASDKKNALNYYVNSGFIGLKSEDILVLDRWIDITEKYKGSGGDVTSWQQEGFRSFKGDQDLLNAVLTISPDIEFSVIGNEGMGFRHPAYLMTHACTKIKPWKKQYLKELVVNGKKPSLTERNFFNYCLAPVALFSKFDFFLRNVDMKSAVVLGRLIGS